MQDFAIKAENWPPDLGTTLSADWLLNCLSGHWLRSYAPDLQQVHLRSRQTTNAISDEIRANAAILYSNGKEMS